MRPARDPASGSGTGFLSAVFVAGLLVAALNYVVTNWPESLLTVGMVALVGVLVAVMSTLTRGRTA